MKRKSKKPEFFFNHEGHEEHEEGTNNIVFWCLFGCLQQLYRQLQRSLRDDIFRFFFVPFVVKTLNRKPI